MEDIIPGLTALAFGLAITIGIFLAIRAIVLWYWKIDTIVENQQKQIQLLTQLVDSMRHAQTPPVESMSHEKRASHQ